VDKNNSNKGLSIGIDASRARSGGAKAHIIGVLSAGVNPTDHGISEVHVWSYKALLDSIPEHPWLVKHNNLYLEKSICHQIFWQIFLLSREAKKLSNDIMLYTDASAFIRFHPCVTMSRDMLSFEEGEIDRFGFSMARLRLLVIKYIQKAALLRSEGVIFLTKYASDIIQKFTGEVKDIKIIPHGVSNDFRGLNISYPACGDAIKCIYVSDASYYKHQWHVIAAISSLRNKGYKVELSLVGAGSGIAVDKVTEAINRYDPKKEFVSILEFVKHYQIPDLLNNSHIYIFASSCENMPNTLIEGMASGLPIACSNRGPMPEVLRSGGVYFDPENPDSISDAVEKIITDKSLRNDISGSAKEYSGEYSWFRCGTETFQYLSEVHKRNILN
jgi:glycosyltransferase involved in cell wall biosynthesis